jgi:hypothetical protein
MSHFAAVLDANVLYSYPLTSVLLELAEARLYRPIWSNDIHKEWIRAKAQVIVTFNEKDFPAAVLEEFDLATQHPDTFLRHLIDLAPNIVRARLAAMIEGFKNPAMTNEEYISVLERKSLPETAAAHVNCFPPIDR